MEHAAHGEYDGKEARYVREDGVQRSNGIQVVPTRSGRDATQQVGRPGHDQRRVLWPESKRRYFDLAYAVFFGARDLFLLTIRETSQRYVATKFVNDDSVKNQRRVSESSEGERRPSKKRT